MQGDKPATSSVPADPWKTVDRVRDLFQRLIGIDLIGIYLHGSLAMGCFNPHRSDVDLLVVAQDALSSAQRRTLVRELLGISTDPFPIELSCLIWPDLHPWRHPAPYDLHFSESWRTRMVPALADDRAAIWQTSIRLDADLAAHCAVTRARGMVVMGAPIEAAIPRIPRTDMLAALRSDAADWPQAVENNPVYCVLNACRMLCFIQDDTIRSKSEGALWALQVLPPCWQGVITAAYQTYLSDNDRSMLPDLQEAHAFLNWVALHIAAAY